MGTTDSALKAFSPQSREQHNAGAARHASCFDAEIVDAGGRVASRLLPRAPPQRVDARRFAAVCERGDESPRDIPYQSPHNQPRLCGERCSATVVDVAQMPGGVKGTDAGYIALMDYLVNSLVKALGAPASGPAAGK